MLANFAAALAFLVVGGQGTVQATDDESFARPDWPTLARSVTIKHFSSENFPTIDVPKAIWALGQDVFCEVKGSGDIDGEYDAAQVSVTVVTPGNWPAQAKPMKVFTHGWGDTSNGDIGESNYPLFVNAWSRMYGQEYDFIVVDWRPLSLGNFEWPLKGPYDTAAQNAIHVGRYLGLCLGQLANTERLDSRIHLIGHSLGAHLMGKAGRVFWGKHEAPVDRITGLDPAGPRFYGGIWWGWNNEAEPSLANNTLTQGSATFVDIIHSNSHERPSAIAIYPTLGAAQPSGHMDFYPSGGMYQPGCRDSALGFAECGCACSHSRAVKYYYWSLKSPEYFPSSACSSLQDCQDGNSPGETVAFMGERAIEFNGAAQFLYNDIDDTCFSFYDEPNDTKCDARDDIV